MDDRHLNNLRETPLTSAARGNVPATSWYLSSVKPIQQQEFKKKRLEREEKLGIAKKDAAAADTSLVDVSVHTVAKSRPPGPVGVGGGSVGRRRVGSLVAQGFGGGDSSEEMTLVPQTNKYNGSDSDATVMQTLDAFAAAVAAGANNTSTKSLKAITEGNEAATAADVDNGNDNGGGMQVTPSDRMAEATATDSAATAASTGRRKSSFLNFFGLGGSTSGKEPPSLSSAKSTTIVTAVTAAASGIDVATPVNATKTATEKLTGKKIGSHKQHHSPPKTKNNGPGNEWVIEGSPEPDNHAHDDAAAAAAARESTVARPTAMSSTVAPTDVAAAPLGLGTQGELGQRLEGATNRKHSRKPSRVVLPPLKQQQQQQQQQSLEPMQQQSLAAADAVVSGGGRQRSQSVAETMSSQPQSRRHRSKSEKSPTSGAAPLPLAPKASLGSEKTMTMTNVINSGLNQSGKVAPDS